MTGSDTDRLKRDDRPRLLHDDDRPNEAISGGEHGRGRSFFWPVVLITVGVVLLLSNLGIFSGGSWRVLLRLWPLLLVLAGLDLLFSGRMPIVGTLLGLGLGAAIVLLLLLGGSGWVEERSNQWGPLQSLFAGVEIESRELVVPRDQTESLELTLDPGQFGARLHTDIGGNDLLAGTVFYARELAYDVWEDGAERAITIRDRSGNVPGLWMSDMSAHRWDLGVNPEVPLALVVDGGSGPVELSLADASLERLVLDGGSGAAAVTLPPREVELNADGASGSLSLQVPAGGRLSGSLDLGSGATTLQAAARSRLSLRLEAGSGSVRISLGDDAAAELDLVDAGSGAFALSLPRSAAVRVVVDEGGSGGLSLPRELRQISDGHDNDPDTGEWQTDGYEEATVRVQLRVRNMGSGAVSVRFG